MKDQPTEMAKETAKQIIADLEVEIEELQHRTRDFATEFVEAEAEVRRLAREWELARSALSRESSARRKAEAVRRVVGQIVLHFDAAKRKPADPPARWEIVPAVSQRSPTLRGPQDQQGASSTDPTFSVCQETSGCRFP